MDVFPGEMSYTLIVLVDIVNDDVAETPERFMFTVESASVLSTSSDTTTTVEIQDNDGEFSLVETN